MSTSPMVSVIMPAYNQAEYISDAIDSVLAQSYSDWELIIVDDGSPDNVADIVSPYTRADSRIRFFHTPNRGVSAARNFGVQQAAGTYILPLDADDIIRPSYIARCMERFEEEPQTDVVYSQWEFFGQQTKNPQLSYKGYRMLLVENSIFVSAMFRKDLFLKAGGYDEQMLVGMEDWEFWIRALDYNSQVYQIPEPLFRYRIKATSRNAIAKEQSKAYDISLYVLAKHREIFNREFGPPIKFLKESIRYKQKYYGLWYKRIWYSAMSLLGKDRRRQ